MRIETIWTDVCIYDIWMSYGGTKVKRTVVYPVETDVELIKADIYASRANYSSVKIISLEEITEAWLKK